MNAQHDLRAHIPHEQFLQLGRRYKRIIMVLADLIALPVALWSAYALRFSEWWPRSFIEEAGYLFLLGPLTGVAVFARVGLYRAVVRYMGAQAIWTVLKGVFLASVLLWGWAYVVKVAPFPRSIPLIYALVAALYVGGSRLIIRSYYHWLLSRYAEKDPVLIFGAGSSGTQLAAALADSPELNCIGFLDENPALWNSVVMGRRVYEPSRAREVISRRGIRSVLLAIPSATHQQRRRIIEALTDLPVSVKTMPAMHEIVSGAPLDRLRQVEIEDLLGRDPTPPIDELVASSIRDKVVMVTGAGGSIGSEICRQVVRNRPRALVLFEIGELALYSIEMELREYMETAGIAVPCHAILGSVLDAGHIGRRMRQFQVDTVYHAAAYKHVPLVEQNVVEGIRNNALGTQVVALAARDAGVERFVLISTDKAVRPTNVMGASKRLAELILQSLGREGSRTVFSMVRFGNVLGSSGSVVPRFRRQISAGGPVTVTHPEITRYFMTIPEAASLVVQAGSMADGGDVFVLNMGEPIRIVDLARRMILLMGFKERTDANPAGDIEIRYVGLRPGEKLYEELLIGENVTGTAHPKIMHATERSLPAPVLDDILLRLQGAIDRADLEAVLVLLKEAVDEYRPGESAMQVHSSEMGQSPTGPS